MFAFNEIFCLEHTMCVGFCGPHHLDQTSTTLTPNFDRCLLEASTKLRPNCDQTSTVDTAEVWSNFGPNLDTDTSKFALGERGEGNEGRGDEETEVCTAPMVYPWRIYPFFIPCGVFPMVVRGRLLIPW